MRRSVASALWGLLLHTVTVQGHGVSGEKAWDGADKGGWPLLFMDVTDVTETWGLMRPRAATVVRSTDLVAPPLDYRRGAVVVGVLVSSEDPGLFEVYAGNTTGYEPLESGGDCGNVVEGDKPKLKVDVLRFTTRDFRDYAKPTVCLSFHTSGDPYPYTLPTVKSLARSTASNETIMVVYDGGIRVYRSIDDGVTFLPSELRLVAARLPARHRLCCPVS